MDSRFLGPRNYKECPKCRRVCMWRRGVHFDHMLRCDNCNFSFDADELWLEEHPRKDVPK